MADSNGSIPFAGNGSRAIPPITIEQGLTALGLPQYIERCQVAGLTSWATLSQLSETDFESLGVSLGHRRKLQRAFAQQHFWPDYLALPTAKEIMGFHSLQLDSESGGSEESITPLSPPEGASSPPTSTRGHAVARQRNGDVPSDLDSRQRPNSTEEPKGSSSTPTKPS